MKHEITDYQGTPVLILGEDITPENAQEFKDILTGLIEAGKSNIILDFENVSNFCSMGIGLTSNLIRLVRKNNGNLKVVHLNSRIQKLFEVTRLNTLLEICGTRREAVEGLEGE